MLLGEEITKRLIDKLIMEVRIAHNPHLQEQESKKLIQELMDRRRVLWGPNEHAGTLDRAALDRLKANLKNTSNAIKVK